VLGYANLATELPPALPCIGLVSKGLHLPDDAHTSIEEMAAAYIEALRPRLAGHPWILGGWCYGGIVAYEMARQLVAAGQPAPFVMMIEAWAHSPADASQRRLLKLAKLAGVMRMPWNHKITLLKNRLGKTNRPTTGTGEQTADDGFLRSVIYQTNLRAIDKYRPGPYHGNLHLMLSGDSDASVIPVQNGGWHVLGARCHVHTIKGGHNLALRPPNVTALARLVAELVDAHKAP
jgi:thioesterase domain-containing protein